MDGGATFNLSFKRKIKTTGQYITTDKQLTGIKILDDSLPMSVELKAYTDAARTIVVVHTVNEGTKLYLIEVVKNARSQSLVQVQCWLYQTRQYLVVF